MLDQAKSRRFRLRASPKELAAICTLVALLGLAVSIYAPPAWHAYSSSRMAKLSLPDLESLVKSQPNNVDARYLLGVAYARIDRYREAIHEFLAVLEKDPSRFDALNDLGVAYLVQERYYEALVAFQGALTAKPDFAPAQANMGRLHLATKMPYTAVRELERAVKLDSSNVPALCDLGRAYLQTLNNKLAEETYKRAIKIDSNSVISYEGLGEIYLNLGRYSEAESVLNKALAIAPDDAPGLLTLARVRMNRTDSGPDLGSIDKLLRRAAQSDPGDPEIWYERGRVELRLGRSKEALAMQEHALQLSPRHIGALHQLERALRAAGRAAEADRAASLVQSRTMLEREEARLEERTTRNSDDWDAKARLAEIYLQSGKQGLSVLIVRQLKENKPDHPRLPMLLQALKPQAPLQVPPALLQGGR